MKTIVLSFSFIAMVLLFSQATCNRERCTANPKPNCLCTQQYDPVCGCNGKTYGNACMAECDRVDVAHQGECP